MTKRQKKGEEINRRHEQPTDMAAEPECPLCLEKLDVDDVSFFPCECGYQVCRFCWHRIRTNSEVNACPNCRKTYTDSPAGFQPLSLEQVKSLRKGGQKKEKASKGTRAALTDLRVVQRNLVFVTGLPQRLAHAEILRKHDFFGRFGKIIKIVVGQSCYITYSEADEALRAIEGVNNCVIEGKTLRCSLGTTKYCSHFLRNVACPKPDCMYLHEVGDSEASFTKEEMQAGKHAEYERKLLAGSRKNKENMRKLPSLFDLEPLKTTDPPPPSLNKTIKERPPPSESQTPPPPPDFDPFHETQSKFEELINLEVANFQRTSSHLGVPPGFSDDPRKVFNFPADFRVDPLMLEDPAIIFSSQSSKPPPGFTPRFS